MSLSSRWTMPARGTPASCGAWCSSALSSVPSQLPLPGCTTSPAGLSITSSASSSSTIDSAIASGRNASSADGRTRRGRRPARRRAPGASRRASAVERDAAGVDPAPAAGCASTAAARAPARRRSAVRRHPPAASACACAGRLPPPRWRRRGAGRGPSEGWRERKRRAGPEWPSVIIDGSVRNARIACSPCRFPIASDVVHWSARPARRGLVVRLATLLVVLALGGCNLLPEVRDETADMSAEALYKLAHDSLMSGNYTRAIKLYETLESRFPYGRYAQQAILESAYANYRSSETATAVAACDRFIRTYPEPSERRLRVLPEGARQFSRGPGAFRLRLRARPVGARAEGHARIVRGVQGARGAKFRKAATRRTPPTG